MGYGRVVPAGSFIADYMEYMSEQETPEDYDFWCALWLMSVACGRDMVVARPRAPVYLNLYIILVADSGITRKSSAIRVATKLASQLIEDDPTIGLLTNKITPEKLDDQLHRRSADLGTGRIAISISELATFLGTERYNAHMPGMLTDLYDCPEIRSGGGTVSRGALSQRDVWLSFLSASTPAWLMRSVNPNVVAGGFSSRCMFVVSERPKRRIAWPQDVDPAQVSQQQSRLLDALRDIRSKAREYRSITVNDAALKRFTSWYRNKPHSSDAYNASFESREDAHVLRIAAFLAINDGTYVIQANHIAFATQLVARIKLDGGRIMSCAGERSRWAVGFDKIRDALTLAGSDTIAKSKLFLKVRGHLDNDEYNALLDVLHNTGGIQRFVFKHEGRGRPTDLIRGTKLLLVRGYSARVVEELNK